MPVFSPTQVINEEQAPPVPEINHAYKMGTKLYDKRLINRNTRILAAEAGNLSVLRAMAEAQAAGRKEIGMNPECFLTELLRDNFELRSSIDGWRSNQTVEILRADAVQANVLAPQMPQNGDSMAAQRSRGLFR